MLGSESNSEYEVFERDSYAKYDYVVRDAYGNELPIEEEKAESLVSALEEEVVGGR